ncbi:hypothetical protein AOL_s00078g540 [Orbilia oligospora ATCC 24927]|uniref:C2H2-type domain-containing protein n=1 Tax=Arthrobotrys oligospora (strain ATCC 24927 / CBS 115.81 / DSM 1491) TaxID=756982 RepID=G1XC93_ARTOA|nr:hypothetical protein AOL_s00078g540 [Orbilia oligospora ATCC 24927]EGX49507.1 hypothetical protein AOL_s00078g540 [Orbilia oligospora ATCC 24927]
MSSHHPRDDQEVRDEDFHTNDELPPTKSSTRVSTKVPTTGEASEYLFSFIEDQSVWSEGRDGSTNTGGVLADAVDLICDIVDSVLDIPEIENTAELEEIQVKFDLWADGVEATTGRLERVIKGLSGLKESIFMTWLVFFRCLTKDKTSEFYDMVVRDHFCRIFALTEKIQYSYHVTLGGEFLEGAEDLLGNNDHEFESHSNLHTDVQSFIEKFREFQKRLSGIAPFIMNALGDIEQDEESCSVNGDEDEEIIDRTTLRNYYYKVVKELKPGSWYQNGIQKLFPNIDSDLLDMIAQMLSVLHRTFRTQASVLEYESSHYFFAAKARRAPRKTRIPVIDTASDSSRSTDEPEDRPQVPPPPQGFSTEAFRCQTCDTMVWGMDTPEKWRKHVLADIKPYICTFTNCKERTGYKSKMEWMAHEVKSHRLITKWKCAFDPCKEKDDAFDCEQKLMDHLIADHNIRYDSHDFEIQDLLNSSRNVGLDPNLSVCRMCQQKLPSLISHLASHIGRHLEDLTLSVLFQWDDSKHTDVPTEFDPDQSLQNTVLGLQDEHFADHAKDLDGVLKRPTGNFSPEQKSQKRWNCPPSSEWNSQKPKPKSMYQVPPAAFSPRDETIRDATSRSPIITQPQTQSSTADETLHKLTNRNSTVLGFKDFGLPSPPYKKESFTAIFARNFGFDCKPARSYLD